MVIYKSYIFQFRYIDGIGRRKNRKKFYSIYIFHSLALNALLYSAACGGWSRRRRGREGRVREGREAVFVV